MIFIDSKLWFKFSILSFLALCLLLITHGNSAYGQAINIVRDYSIEQNQQYSSLMVIADMPAEYEVFNYLPKKTITLKIRGASLTKTIAKIKRFNDNFIRQVTVNKVDPNEVWVEISTVKENIHYDVDDKLLKQGILALRLRAAEIERKFQPKAADALASVTFASKVNSETLQLNFNKNVSYSASLQTLPNVELVLRINDVKPEFDITKNNFDSAFIEGINYKQKGKNLEIELKFNDPRFKYEIKQTTNPNQISLVVQPANPGLPVTDEDRYNFLASPKLNASKDEFFKRLYIAAEEDFRNNAFTQAYAKFSAIAKDAYGTEVAAMAEFRAADSANEIQKAVKHHDGYFQVIKIYENAINNALNKKTGENQIAKGYYEIAENFRKGMLFEEAGDYYNKIISEFPSSIYISKALFGKADIAFSIKKFDDAVRYFQDYRLRYPVTARTKELDFRLATAYHAIGNYSLAYKYFSEGRSLGEIENKLSPFILYAEANTYSRVGQHQKFINVARNLISDYPNELISTIMAIDLGDYFLLESDIVSASSNFDFAIAKGTPDIKLIARLKLNKLRVELHNQADIKTITKEFEAIYNQTTKASIKEEALIHLGISYLTFQQYSEAARIFDLYKERFPQGTYVVNKAITALEKENLTNLIANSYINGNHSDVISHYVRFRQQVLNSKDELLLLLIANSYSQLGNFRDAAAFNQQLLKIGSRGRIGEISFSIGDSLNSNGDKDEALRYYSEVVEKFPNSIFSSYSLSRIAKIYEEQRRYDDAIASYEKLLSINEDSTDPIIQDLLAKSWNDLCQLQNNLGLFDKALKSYNSAIDAYRHPIRDPDVESYVVNSFYQRAHMNRLLNADDQALLNYNLAINNFPGTPEYSWSLFYISEILQKQQKLVESVAVIDRLLALPEGVSTSLRNLAIEKKRSIEIDQNFANFLRGDSQS